MKLDVNINDNIGCYLILKYIYWDEYIFIVEKLIKVGVDVNWNVLFFNVCV